MKKFLLLLLLAAWSVPHAFAGGAGGCLSGETWTASWTDEFNQTTYTLEAPVEACIGVEFNIVVTVTDAAYPSANVGGPWSVKDNGITIASGGVLDILLSGGQWQKIISQTYSGAPVDHTLEFVFTDHGSGSSGHNIAGSTIGAVTLDPYVAPLPRTGQSSCWDSAGNPLACTDPLAAGQDGAVLAGEPWPEPRFTDNLDGTVTDNLTGLVWLKDANCFGLQAWSAALGSANGLADGSCGLSDGSVAGDWRIPNARELESLVNIQEWDSYFWLNSQGFSAVQPDDYWSATSYALMPDNALYVNFFEGMVNGKAKTNNAYIWPVRSGQPGLPVISIPKTGQDSCWDEGGQLLATCSETGQDGELRAGVAWPSPRFADNGDGTVTDNLTGLIWLKNANCAALLGGIEKSTTLTWGNALVWSRNLASGSCGLSDNSAAGDWRLPNRKELNSLIHAGQGQSGPWLGGQGFSGVQSYFYWSGDTSASYPTGAWAVGMDGSMYVNNKTVGGNVWPVRGGTIEPQLPPCGPIRAIYGPSGNTSGSYRIYWEASYGTPDATYVLTENDVEIYRGASRYVDFTGKPSGSYSYAVRAVKAGYADSAAQGPLTTNVTLSCGFPVIYGPTASTTGSYRINWKVSSTPGVTYVLTENGAEIYRGMGYYKDLTGKGSGSYVYAVKAIKDGYADSAATALTISVTPTCGVIRGLYGPTASTTGSYRIYWEASYGTAGATYVLTENDVEIYRGPNRYKDFTGKGSGSYGYAVKAIKDGYVDSAVKGPLTTVVTR